MTKEQLIVKQEIINFLEKEIEKYTNYLEIHFDIDPDYLVGEIDMAERTIDFINNLKIDNPGNMC